MHSDISQLLLEYENEKIHRIEVVKKIVEFAPTDSLKAYITFIIQTIYTQQCALADDLDDIIKDLSKYFLIPEHFLTRAPWPENVSSFSFEAEVKQVISEMEQQGELRVTGGMRDSYRMAGIIQKIYILIPHPVQNGAT